MQSFKWHIYEIIDVEITLFFNYKIPAFPLILNIVIVSFQRCGQTQDDIKSFYGSFLDNKS